MAIIKAMGRAVCSVRGKDHRGYAKVVLVEAASVFEAAALGLERLHQEGGRVSSVEITVHRPDKQYTVAPQQLTKWLVTRSESETIGLTALKRRVRELLKSV